MRTTALKIILSSLFWCQIGTAQIVPNKSYFIGKWQADSMITMNDSFAKFVKLLKECSPMRYQYVRDTKIDIALHDFCQEMMLFNDLSFYGINFLLNEPKLGKWNTKENNLVIDGGLKIGGNYTVNVLNERNFVLHKASDSSSVLYSKIVK